MIYLGVDKWDMSYQTCWIQDSYLSAKWMGTSVPRGADVIAHIKDGSGVIVDDRGKVVRARPGRFYLLSAVRKMDFCADTSRLSLIYGVRGNDHGDRLVRQCVPSGNGEDLSRIAIDVRKHINRSSDDVEWQGIIRRLNEAVEASYPVENPGVTCDSAFQNLLLQMHCGRFDAVRTVGLSRSLADFSNMSERSIQMKFRRYLGVSPAEYMRNITLDEAHRLLSDPGESAGVGEVAARLGFSNPGRFAEHYLQRHNEMPSATLRRARVVR
ncbi:helix-turn-helix domain-containing protein [Curtobacterium sp. TC1]|uniref:helix-turn-helix domain-containing protein n=1 Tax=Curtobacterium sp. TC1 TaxID=2862880 RepID=UPI0021C0FB5B|nr:helix-turn-helix domain-containing protein [Curtobacterium sp. TC1]